MDLNNNGLKKYEIKAPDYDYAECPGYIEENYRGYSPARFTREADCWKSKDRTIKDCVKIMFAGDITCFQNQFVAAEENGIYDFRYEFEVVKELFSQSDLAIGNLETMIVPQAPYRNEKFVSEENYFCNAPIEFLEAVKTCGFDVLTNANNHDLDTGAVGIGETIDNIEGLGFIQTGTFKSDKKHYELIDVNGFKIAITAFATGHNNKHVNLTDEGKAFLLNQYSAANAKLIIEDARKHGAEVVFSCIHWGTENVHKYNSKQEKIASELTELGYDCIIGSHPHVLQPFSFISTENKSVPVFYSMGNFVSHNANNAKGRSIIACIELKRNSDGEVALTCQYIPIFTSKNYKGREFVVLPIHSEPSDSRNKKRKREIEDIIGEQITIDKSLSFDEYIDERETRNLRIRERIEKRTSVGNDDKQWPFFYDDGTFLYEVCENYAYLTGVSEFCNTSSSTMKEVIEGCVIVAYKEGALSNDSRLKKISFNRNIPEISPRLCKGCSGLEGFRLGMNTREIGEEAFTDCKKLSAAVMRKKTKIIGRRAFADCTELRSIKITPSVEYIADDAFEGCPKLTIYCEKGSYAEQYAMKKGIPFINMKLS